RAPAPRRDPGTVRITGVRARVLTGARRGPRAQALERHQSEEFHMSVTTDKAGASVRPFNVDIPDEALEDLHRRIAATRLPSKELVEDRSQGVQLATIRELTRYWATDYDWRKCESRLNALPQFKTEIDGVDVHFIHVKSRHDDA